MFIFLDIAFIYDFVELNKILETSSKNNFYGFHGVNGTF